MNKYILALLKCKGLGNVKVLNYILKYKKDIELIKRNLDKLVCDEDMQKFEMYLNQAETEIIENKKQQIEMISVFDDNYPIKLLKIKDPILYLYYKGNIKLIYNTSIAIIGSRDIDCQYESITKDISKKISSTGVTVVSGLANGTDTQAHIGSLNQLGKTIAVLASGLNIITPSNNKILAENILKNNGLLVSEYPINMNATKYSFVKRDRIQAALSDAIIVVKASINSGTMHAVKVALEAQKYVTQYKKNENIMINNSFDNNENDILNIIKIAKKQKYFLEEPKIYEQETLF